MCAEKTENPAISVYDPATVMLEKATAYLTAARDRLYPQVSKAARAYEVVHLDRKHEAIKAILHDVHMNLGEMEPELSLPRVVADSSAELKELRAKYDIVILRRPYVTHSAILDAYPGVTLEDVRREVRDMHEKHGPGLFAEYTKLDTYARLQQINKEVDRLIEDCVAVANTCCVRCKTRGSYQTCEKCSAKVCGTDCHYEHKCTPGK